MKIKQYDRILLQDGSEASIVEVFAEDSFFLADIDKDGDTYTEEVSIDQIKMVQIVCDGIECKTENLTKPYLEIK